MLGEVQTSPFHLCKISDRIDEIDIFVMLFGWQIHPNRLPIFYAPIAEHLAKGGLKEKNKKNKQEKIPIDSRWYRSVGK